MSAPGEQNPFKPPQTVAKLNRKSDSNFEVEDEGFRNAANALEPQSNNNYRALAAVAASAVADHAAMGTVIVPH